MLIFKYKKNSQVKKGDNDITKEIVKKLMKTVMLWMLFLL